MEIGAAANGHAPQHMRALEHANRVRAARADLKRRVAAGEVHAADVVLAHPWMVESMPLAELLICQRSWGQTRCRTFLKSVGLGESKTLGCLTERQRIAIAVVLSTNPGRAIQQGAQ
jgi:hypothetical protein